MLVYLNNCVVNLTFNGTHQCCFKIGLPASKWAFFQIHLSKHIWHILPKRVSVGGMGEEVAENISLLCEALK